MERLLAGLLISALDQALQERPWRDTSEIRLYYELLRVIEREEGSPSCAS